MSHTIVPQIFLTLSAHELKYHRMFVEREKVEDGENAMYPKFMWR